MPMPCVQDAAGAAAEKPAVLGSAGTPRRAALSNKMRVLGAAVDTL